MDFHLPPDPRLAPMQRALRREFAWRGALAALLVALLLELCFGIFGVSQYFYDKSASVLIMQHSAQQVNEHTLGTGDVQVTLTWKGTDDVDLHVVDPYGQRIFFDNRQVGSGGRLDLDMNAGEGPWHTNGTENVYWPQGAAPPGVYHVFVHHYRRNGGPDAIPFRVRILNKGDVIWKEGVARYAPSSGGSTEARGLDPSNALPPQEVASFTVSGGNSGLFLLRPAQLLALLTVGAWTAALCAALAWTLLRGINGWYRAQFGTNPHVAAPQLVDSLALRGIVGRALGWGLALGALAQVLFAALTFAAPFALDLWRALGWMLLAGWSGARLGRLFSHHLPVGAARWGGLWGGFLGGALFGFLLLSGNGALMAETDTLGRLLGALLIGGAIGSKVQLPVWLPPIETPEAPARDASPVSEAGEIEAREPVLAFASEVVAEPTEIEPVEDAPREWQDSTWKSNPGMPRPADQNFEWKRRGGARELKGRHGAGGRKGAQGRRWKPGA